MSEERPPAGARLGQPDSDFVVETQELQMQFGELTALSKVNLQIRPGEIFGILGPNGSGKTTLMRILTGLLDPSGGFAFVGGVNVASDPERVKSMIGYVAQRVSLYDDLTILENIQFYASIYGAPASEKLGRKERVERALLAYGLSERKSQMAGHLSGGWRQRVALACATMHQPKLVFLDEPTAGLDPATRRDFWETIHQIASRGTTIIVNTHYTDEADRCHRVGFLFSGHLLQVGPPKELSEGLGLEVVELEVEDGSRAASLLEASPQVVEVGHFGNVLRVATRSAQPEELCRSILQGSSNVISCRNARTTIEDVFVEKVRERGLK